MAKYKFYVSTGFVGADRAEIVEIPDDELEGMTEMEQDVYVDENYFQDWLSNNADMYFSKVDE